eukprot:Lankesteria_metandrocarpae@DN2284_c0_g1_i1.p1
MSVPPNEGSAVLQHPIVSVSVEWRRDLLRIALERQALRFGQFTLKSGRRSPYFFNSGRFDDGASFSALCAAYAQGIVEAVTSGALPEFDVLYGPASTAAVGGEGARLSTVEVVEKREKVKVLSLLKFSDLMLYVESNVRSTEEDDGASLVLMRD